MYHFYLQKLMRFATAFAGGFVLGKRTQIRGGLWGVFIEKWVRFMETNPLGNLKQTRFEGDIGSGATGAAAAMRNDGKRDARPTSGSEQV